MTPRGREVESRLRPHDRKTALVMEPLPVLGCPISPLDSGGTLRMESNFDF